MRTRAQSAPLAPSVYLGVEPDGTVFIVTHRSEMGTGIRTSLPLVAADELEADWSRVRIEQGLGDPKYGDQNTDGSRSIRDFYEAFRRAGASARVMLVSAAAAQWGVPASRVRGPEPRGGASAERPAPGVRRAGARRRQAARSGARDAALQAEGRVEVRRPGTADLRPGRHHHRQGAVRPRHLPRQHGGGLDRASAGRRRLGEERRATPRPARCAACAT